MKLAYANIRKISISFDSKHLYEVFSNFKIPTEMELKLYSYGLEESNGTVKFIVNDIVNPTILPEIPPIACPINDIRYIRGQKIVLALYIYTETKIGICIGQAVCLLQGASYANYENKTGIIERYSHNIGVINYQMKLSL